MNKDDHLHELVRALYAPLCDGARWREVLGTVGDLFDGGGVILALQDLQTREPFDIRMDRRHQHYFELMIERGYATPETNPLMRASVHLPRGTSHRHVAVSDAEYLASGLFNEVDATISNHPWFMSQVWQSPRAVGVMGVCHHEFDKTIDPEHERLIGVLAPHFQQVLTLSERLSLERARASSAEATLDSLRLAVILVDAGARILFTNAAGQALLDGRRGLHTVKSRLAADAHADTLRLQALVDGALATTSSKSNDAGGSISLERAASARPLSVLVAPLPFEDALPGFERAQVVVMVDDPDLDQPAPVELLAETYGFTNRESELVAHLLRGESLAEAAEALEVSLNTVKTHQKSVFAKAGVRRQAELVRLLLRTPAAAIRR